MNKNRIRLPIAALAVAMIAMMLASAYSYGMWNFDEKYGTFTTVQVGVAGNYVNGKLYSPAAYVKGIVDQNITGGHTLVVHYYFEWVDLNHVAQYQNGTAEIPGFAGNWVRIVPTGLPSAVYFIAADGRNEINGEYDTEMASASLPML